MSTLIQNLKISSVEEAEEILKSAGTEDLFEKAHQDGDMHPNGKWVWRLSANRGKGDWRVIKKTSTEKKEAIPDRKNKSEYQGKSKFFKTFQEEYSTERILNSLSNEKENLIKKNNELNQLENNKKNKLGYSIFKQDLIDAIKDINNTIEDFNAILKNRKISQEIIDEHGGKYRNSKQSEQFKNKIKNKYGIDLNEKG